MKRYILFLALAFTSCTNPTKATQTLEDNGFSDIVITGHNFFMCGKDDFSATGFEAKNVNNKKIKGTVCCGILLKGCTIRF